MKRVIPISLALAAGTIFTSAAVAIPPVLDLVPADASLIAAIPNSTKAHREATQLATAIQSPVPIPGLSDLFANAELPGVDTDRPVVMYMTSFPNPEEAEEPGMVALLPVNDYDAFVSSFGGTAGGGVDELPDRGWTGEFARKLPNGYAAISKDRALLEKMDDGGRLDLHQSHLGPAGRKLADAGDAFILIDVADHRDAVGQMLDGFFDQAEMMMMMSGAGGDMTGAKAALTNLIGQTDSVVVSLDASNLGVSLDLAMNFTAGSEMDTTFSAAGKASGLLGRLPNQPFFFAGSFDTSSAAMKKLFSKATTMGAGVTDDPEAARRTQAQIDAIDGGAMMVGFVPAIMSGAFQKTVVYYQSSKPGAVAASTKDMLSGLDGLVHEDPSMGSMAFSSTYEPDADSIDGVSIDQYAIGIRMENAGSMPMNPMMMLFGPYGGPRGYVAKLDSGIIQTMARDKALMSQAIASAKGGADSLGADRLLAQVASKLPENRVFEGYIGFKSVIDAIRPLAAMGMPALGQIDIPDQMPPVGMGIGAMSGDALASIFIPAPVIKTTMDLQAAVQGGMGGGGFDQGDPDEDAGQPKF